MTKPKIWVKTYPYTEQIIALTDLASQDIGIEIFLGKDKKTNEECLRICRENYPRFGIELFFYQDEEGKKKIIYDPFSQNMRLRESSRDYLFMALELAEEYGATHLQLDANDGCRGKPGDDMNAKKQEMLAKKKELLVEIVQKGFSIPLYFENTIPIDDNSPEPIFTCTGHNLSDFVKEGLPLEYDLTHHAIALDVYSRAKEFDFPLTKEEKRLAKKVRKRGITEIILRELKRIHEKIYFVHFDNASRFELQKRAEHAPENSKDELIDLERILPFLIEKSENITPEVDDEEYIKRPNLRNWIKRLQDF